MGKIFTVIVLLMFVSNACFASGFELSDVIKEARKNEKLKITQANCNEKNINNINSEIPRTKQNTNEKINHQEIINKNIGQ